MRVVETAIITGPTGAVGTALCKTLVEKHIKVYAIVRPNSRRSNHLQGINGLNIIPCDAVDIANLPELLNEERVDAFFHFAWAKTTGLGRDDMQSQIDNIRHTINAVRVAADLDCRVFIGAGSQAEYGRVDHAMTPDTPCFPENGYGMAKLCAGQMSRVECEKLGIDHIWPRILSVYGPYDGKESMVSTVIRSVLAGQKPALTAGEQLWDFLYSEDVAEALYQLAVKGKSGEIYPLGSGYTKPLRSYIEIIRDNIDPSVSLGFGKVPYGDKQVMHLEADISALKKDTGFEPKTDFKAGIRKTIEYMRKHNNE